MFDGDRVRRADCLPGVTMRLIGEALDGQVTTAPITLDQLADVDAVFATNAAIGIRTVGAIDDIQWPDEHPVLSVLRKHYTGIPVDLL